MFRPALEHLRVAERYPGLRIVYLPASLHLHPQALQLQLHDAVARARQQAFRITCLYGECFPEIDDFCRQHDVTRVRGAHCYELLMGTPRYQALMEETAGTYFLERELLEHFETQCIEPLELTDPDLRREYFRHYRRVIYVRQPDDPDLVARATELAAFLDLPLQIVSADYRTLDTELAALLDSGSR